MEDIVKEGIIGLLVLTNALRNDATSPHSRQEMAWGLAGWSNLGNMGFREEITD